MSSTNEIIIEQAATTAVSIKQTQEHRQKNISTSFTEYQRVGKPISNNSFVLFL